MANVGGRLGASGPWVLGYFFARVGPVVGAQIKLTVTLESAFTRRIHFIGITVTNAGSRPVTFPRWSSNRIEMT